tara:strand:+ start:583 stop:978 length:396 start_codon:yes stop_codon:yes gene_type:complete
MKQNTDIDQFEKKQSFKVPENYFLELKSDIQSKTEKLELKFNLSHYFNLKITVPILVSVLILFMIFNYIPSSDSIDNNVLSEEIYTQFVEFEIENINEEYLFEFLPDEDYVFSDEIEYLIENDIDYDLIIK